MYIVLALLVHVLIQSVACQPDNTPVWGNYYQYAAPVFCPTVPTLGIYGPLDECTTNDGIGLYSQQGVVVHCDTDSPDSSWTVTGYINVPQWDGSRAACGGDVYTSYNGTGSGCHTTPEGVVMSIDCSGTMEKLENMTRNATDQQVVAAIEIDHPSNVSYVILGLYTTPDCSDTLPRDGYQFPALLFASEQCLPLQMYGITIGSITGTVSPLPPPRGERTVTYDVQSWAISLYNGAGCNNSHLIGTMQASDYNACVPALEISTKFPTYIKVVEQTWSTAWDAIQQSEPLLSNTTTISPLLPNQATQTPSSTGSAVTATQPASRFAFSAASYGVNLSALTVVMGMLTMSAML